MNLNMAVPVNQIDQVVRNHPKEVQSLIGKMVHRSNLSVDDKEELIQDIYLRVLESYAAKYDGSTAISTYICGITRQCVLNKLKAVSSKRKRGFTCVDNNISDKGRTDPAQALMQKEAWQQLEDEPDAAVRDMLVKRFVHSMTLEAIAEEVGCSVSLVHKRISKWCEEKRGSLRKVVA
jgi:RNA polymerase sigma factor (sigma-70 family)